MGIEILDPLSRAEAISISTPWTKMGIGLLDPSSRAEAILISTSWVEMGVGLDLHVSSKGGSSASRPPCLGWRRGLGLSTSTPWAKIGVRLPDLHALGEGRDRASQPPQCDDEHKREVRFLNLRASGREGGQAS